ncbi:hypothetical protein SAMN04487905_11231 [Actinopolyspora xinjiangensis]|uniref:NADAR domain-containing protein n=2 Tax=Actinopolyspora xinjiangensis TaxID=405564 RepID=A0A1H0WGD0_9ACTN|nr:NADAR family protein [Actinopolyspora xinjiangensis]SDP89555.1 hypothetical protein SAMN04487905_11231 [Actinopolyspora xinjiangensis]
MSINEPATHEHNDAATGSARRPRDVAELVERMRLGVRTKFVFFWGHRPERDGSPGRGCLSQWWPAPFIAHDRVFATAEHYMMWRKARLFGDEEMAEQILAAEHPHRAKTLGREVRGFDQRQWERERFAAVVTGNVAKFAQHEEPRRFLRDTGDRVLVEASPRDKVWGIGLAADDPAADDPERWPGLNLLGFALMEVRETLREHGPID